jgi:hypothetical protein
VNTAVRTRRRRHVLIAVAIAWAAVVSFVLAPSFARWVSEPSGGSTPSATSPVADQFADLKLMDYYPSNAAWTYMWTKWNPARVDGDFAKIAALGANSVRLNIEPDTFGFPHPSTSMTDELAAAIKAASAHGLTVQLTLFDWWDSYGNKSGSDEWVKALLAPYSSDFEIAFIDVKNEIDPGDAAAMTWLEHELPVVKSAAGSDPVTVSVTGSNLLGNLASVRRQLGDSQPDFYDIHYYDQSEHALATFEQAKSLVSPLPLFIGETGKTTGKGGAANVTYDEQDLYLRSVEWAAQAAGLPDAAPWIFEDIESTGVPSNANQAGGELDFGLFTDGGNAKPAAASIKALFQSGTISPGINGDFSVGNGTDVADWIPSRANGAKLAWDETVGHDAAGSVRLSDTGTSADGNPAYYMAPVVQPTAAGQDFEMTAWAKGEDASGENRIAICWFDANGTYLSESDSPVLATGTTDWQQLTVTSQSPSGAAYELIYLKSGGNTGTVYFDDVTFAKEG